MTPLIIYICVNISYCLMDNNEQYLAACINLIIFTDNFIFNNVESVILAFICSIF